MTPDPPPPRCPPGVDYKTWADAMTQECQNGVRRRIIGELAPQFLPDPKQQTLARGIALHAVQSYLPEADADWFNAADTISFSLASLDLLRDTVTQDMTQAMKLRFIDRAIQSARTARAAEAALQKRRKEREAMGPDRVYELRFGIAPNAEPAPQPAPPPTQPPVSRRDLELEAMVAQIISGLDGIDTAIAEPDAAQPNSAQPEAAEPKAPLPDTPHPEASPPEAGCAEHTQPQLAGTQSAHPQPDHPKPETATAETPRTAKRAASWFTALTPAPDTSVAYQRQLRRLQRQQKRQMQDAKRRSG